VTSTDLDGFRRGDPEDFRRLVEELSPRLLSMLRSYAADSDEALDLLQQTWLRTFRQRRSFAGRGSLAGWIMAIARNTALDAVRARQHRPADAGARGAAEPWEAVSPESRSTERELERVELGRALDEALLQLPERQRDVVVFRLVEGRSVWDTARLMGCAEGTVKATLHHALTSLKRTLMEWRT
jgi:RNA polymerase sigma-70 factor (ECF subfamily)